MNREIEFAGGRNIAMKVPPHQWDETVRFYRDVVRLEVIDHEPTERQQSRTVAGIARRRSSTITFTRQVHACRRRAAHS
jgi:hypothetical protein